MRTLPSPFRGPFAHRGYHGQSLPENSLPAFLWAIRRGFGIELDVQLTADGVPVVFHDATAQRMCSLPRRISDLTLAELRPLRLSGTQEGIPTLEEALAVIGDQVPLIVELKQTPFPENLVRKTLSLLRRFHCRFLVESFDPRLLRLCRKLDPQVLRGQLGFGLRYPYPASIPARLLLSGGLPVLLSRPDVLVWDIHTCRTPWFRLLQAMIRRPLILWTIRTEEEQKLAEQLACGWIFEEVGEETEQV